MKKIFESKFHTIDSETAEKVYVFQFESDDEFWEYSNATHEERCKLFDVQDLAGFDVAPGATYHTYRFDNGIEHAIMYE